MPRRRLAGGEMAAAQAKAGGGSDNDLPEDQRRSRTDTLTLSGRTVAMQSRVSFGDVLCHVLGPGRGVDRWLVSWVETEDGGDHIQVGTAHVSQLSVPPL